MTAYIIRRLILLPVTLFFILLVNFVIINLAPGEPTTVTEISQEGGATRQENGAAAFGSDQRFLQFRERYGLTLPILWNNWPFISRESVKKTLEKLAYEKDDMSFKTYQALRIRFGDQARWVMPQLIKIMTDSETAPKVKEMAARFFIRGGWRMVTLGPNLSEAVQKENEMISLDNQFLLSQGPDSIEALNEWYQGKDFTYSTPEKIQVFFFETRFFRYLSRVLTLDFGTLRDDPNKTVIKEVAKRLKYSLTLALTPMLITFFICLILGMTMAVWQNLWPDYTINVISLILYAIPIFVVAPFLIEKVALHNTFPFTNIPIPISGFSSPEQEFVQMTSSEKVADIFCHILLPIIAIMYGSLATQARLARTSILEVLRQDYVRTARAKGLAPMRIYTKHVGRNAAITIVTSIAGSLGIVLGGSLIVETLFEIDGFGKFFYDGVINRDYNVILFSAIAGSFLTLLGYLIADIAYTILDPRVSL